MAPVKSLSDAVTTAFASALSVLLAGIPKIIGFLVILIVGWIIAALVAKAVASVLRAVHFDNMAQRSGLAGFVRDMGMTTDSSGVVAGAAKWFIRLIFLVAAFDALGLPAISAVLQRLLLWIPNLIVALVILVIGGLLASALSRIVRGATTEAGLGNPGLLATLAQWAVWGFAIIIAVNQIGVASTLVNTLFTGFVAALALAIGLSFGLGGRETAAQIVQNWYRQGQQAAPRMSQAANAAGQQTQAMGQQARATAAGSNGPAAQPANAVIREQRSRS